MRLRGFLSIAVLAIASFAAPPALADLGPAQHITLYPSAADAYPGYPPYAAYDRNAQTMWNSGHVAPAWIDLWFYPNTEWAVWDVWGQIATYPNGDANNTVYGRRKDGTWDLLGFLNGFAVDGFWLSTSMVGNQPYAGLTIYTTQNPGWVAWREFQVYGAQYTVPPPPPSPSLPPGVFPPVNPGDVVMRDLTVPGFGFLGHIALWDGASVLQAMGNETPAIQAVGFENFSARDTTWPTITTNIEDHQMQSCYKPECQFVDPYFYNGTIENLQARMAIVKRARQILLIGADYTLTTSVRMATPRMYDPAYGTYTPAKRGFYRCDTYVMDAFQYSDNWGGENFDPFNGGGYPVTRRTWTEMLTWEAKIRGMMTSPGWTPVQLYNRIKSW